MKKQDRVNKNTDNPNDAKEELLIQFLIDCSGSEIILYIFDFLTLRMKKIRSKSVNLITSAWIYLAGQTYHESKPKMGVELAS